MPKIKNKLQFLILSALAILMPAGAVAAQSFVQGYEADDVLLRGTIVSLNQENKDKVDSINQDRNAETLGVIVRSNDAAVTLASENSSVTVATSGRYEVLVNSVNGNLSAGDFVTTSPITGIGQKADRFQELVVGKVVEDVDFNDGANVLRTVQVTNSLGESTEVVIARVLADISVEANPGLYKSSELPAFFATTAEEIAGEPVSALRVYASLGVLVVAGGVAGSLTYSGVKTSILSIGRNPLSKNSVLKGLAQVIAISIIIFICGVVAVYLILKI